MNSQEQQQGHFGQPQPPEGFDFGPLGAAEQQAPKFEDLPTQRLQQLGHLGLKAENIPNVQDTQGNSVNVIGDQVVMRRKRGERPDGTPIWENITASASPDQQNAIQGYRAAKATNLQQQTPNFTPKQPDFGSQTAQKQSAPKVAERPSRREVPDETPEDTFFSNPLQSSTPRQSPKLSPAAQRLNATEPAPELSIERGASAALAAAQAAEQASSSTEQRNRLNDVARPNHRR